MIDLSIVVTAHREGIVLHKTLLAITSAVRLLQDHSYSFEVIIHMDNPDSETTEYVKRSTLIPPLHATVYANSFGDPGTSRNFAAQKAKARYITFIDGDDICSENWFVSALQTLKSHEVGSKTNEYIAHPESVIEFGATTSVNIRQGAIDHTTDTLLSVYANRWNVVLMCERSVLLKYAYVRVDGAYGYEDWRFNCQTIHQNMRNVLAPKTCLFVRRKVSDSVWAQHKGEQRVLQANELLSFAHVRSLRLDDQHLNSQRHSLRFAKLKIILAKNKVVLRAATTLYATARKSQRSNGYKLPEWLTATWQKAHDIDRDITPVASPPVYNTISQDHWDVGIAYKKIVDHTSYDHYDYLLFVPWITVGGADKYALHYINTLHSLDKNKRLLVVATLPEPSPWATKLADTIDFVPFGQICQGLGLPQRMRLLEQFIENSGAHYLHILNSADAYEFTETHSHYIRSSGKKVIITSFSQSIDETGRVFGYSHTHVPRIYDIATVISSDNQTVLDMWESFYGFDATKLSLLRQPVTPETTGRHITKASRHKTALRILWAARLSPEKQPEIVANIGKLVAGHPVRISMFGHIDTGFNADFLRSLPPNVEYCGPFDGFTSLHPERYDLYLYTSLFDGMPNAILEAGAAGLPILSSAVGGVPEVVHHESTGLLVHDVQNPHEYAKAITDILEQPDALDNYSTAMRNLLEKEFSEKKYTSTLKTIAKKIGYLQ